MLTTIELSPTDDTPKIILNAVTGKMEISGKSMPEDATQLYTPIKEWLLEYAKDPSYLTEFVCNIEYFNSTSARNIMELFVILEEIKDSNVSITWYYEKGDKLMKLKGEEFKVLLSFPFEVKVLK